MDTPDKEKLIKILDGNIELINQINARNIQGVEEWSVLIKPDHVRNMLLRFLCHDISDKNLIEWARFIDGNIYYTCVDCNVNDELESELCDYYEDMMDVIQRLAIPQIHGEVTEEQVRLYLSNLSKY